MLTTRQTQHLTALINALETARTELGDLVLDLEATEIDDDDAEEDISMATEALGFLEHGLEDVAIKFSDIRCKLHLDRECDEAAGRADAGTVEVVAK
jgi:hypothetical protein